MTLIEAGLVFLTGAFLAATLLKIGHLAGVNSSKSVLSSANSVMGSAASVARMGQLLASRAQTDYHVSMKTDLVLAAQQESTKTVTDLRDRVEKMDVSLYNLQNVVAQQQPSRGRQRQAMEAMGRKTSESPTPVVETGRPATSGLWGTKSEEETVEVQRPASRTGADRLT